MIPARSCSTFPGSPRGGSRGSCSTVRASPIVNAAPNEGLARSPPTWAGLTEAGGGSADTAIASTSLAQQQPLMAQLPILEK